MSAVDGVEEEEEGTFDAIEEFIAKEFHTPLVEDRLVGNEEGMQRSPLRVSDDDIEEYIGDSSDDEHQDCEERDRDAFPARDAVCASSGVAPSSLLLQQHTMPSAPSCHACNVTPRPGVTLECLVDGQFVCQQHATCYACDAHRSSILVNLINIEGRMFHPECLQCRKCKVDMHLLHSDQQSLRIMDGALYCPTCGPCQCGACNNDVCVDAPDRGGDGAKYGNVYVLFEHRRCETCDKACGHDIDPDVHRPRSRQCLVCNFCMHDTSATVDVMSGGPNPRNIAGRVHLCCAKCLVCDGSFERKHRVVSLEGGRLVHLDCITCAICHKIFNKSMAENVADRTTRSIRGHQSGWVHYACRKTLTSQGHRAPPPHRDAKERRRNSPRPLPIRGPRRNGTPGGY